MAYKQHTRIYRQELLQVKMKAPVFLYNASSINSYEVSIMGCCGSCGGEAPNHTPEDKSDPEKKVETEKNTSSQSQNQGEAQDSTDSE
jgi:hypothetical protein